MSATSRSQARRIGLSLLAGLIVLAGYSAEGLTRDNRRIHPRRVKRGKAPANKRAIGKALQRTAKRAAAERAAKAKARIAAARARAAKARARGNANKATQAKRAANKPQTVKAPQPTVDPKAAQAKRRAKDQADRATLLARAKQLRAKRAHPPTQGKVIAGTVQRRVKSAKGSLLNRIIFYVLFTLCVCFSLVTITRKSPLMAALSLLVVFLGLAGVYLFLQAPFMAVMQIIVYAGAVIVLFVFVIMSIGFNEERSISELGTEIFYFVCAFVLTAGGAMMFHFGDKSVGYLASFAVMEALALGIFLYMRYHWATRFLGTAALTFAMLQIVRLTYMTPVTIGKAVGLKAAPNADPTTFATTTGAGFGEARSIGHSVFNDNVFTFEALSLLLLAAIVAAVVIVRSRKEKEEQTS